MRRLTALVALVVAMLVSLLVAATPGLADPPPNPSDGQISEAQRSQQALATELGSLQAQAAQLQGEILGLQATADAAIATYDATTAAVITALDEADRAKAALDLATTQAAAARRAVQVVAHDTYVQGAQSDGGAALLFTDSADVDFTVAAASYLAQRQGATLSTLEVANVAASNAEVARREALAEAERLQARADVEQQAAIRSLGTAQGRQAQLRTTLDDVNSRAATASAALSGLLDQRAAYDAYLAEVRRKEAEAEAARVAAEQAKAEAAAAAAAASRSSNGSSSASRPSTPVVSAPGPAPSSNGQWGAPMRGYSVTSCYCARWGTFHHGIDLNAGLGAPIYAVGPGVVVAAGPASGFGNWVVINHRDGTFSIYGHMRVLTARVGQEVTAGVLIAYEGNEGESTGAHLHFEVRVGSYGSASTSTDPRVWLARRGVTL